MPTKKGTKKPLRVAASGLPSKTHNYIVAYGRRVFGWYPARKNVKDRAKRQNGLFECAHCMLLFPRDQIEVNHIDPVIPLTGFDDWNGFYSRLFCDESGLEALCKGCHKVQTHEIQNKKRREIARDKASDEVQNRDSEGSMAIALVADGENKVRLPARPRRRRKPK